MRTGFVEELDALDELKSGLKILRGVRGCKEDLSYYLIATEK